MKKQILILPFLLIVMFFPYVVSAEEKCQVVNGNGKSIGSEIVCGTEHFYIFENVDNNLRLLSKYNLLAGMSYDHVVINGSVSSYQGNAEATELINQGYEYDNRFYDSTTNKTEYIFVKKDNIIPEVIKQDEKAIGAHGQTRGQAELPEFGSFYATSLYGTADTSNIYDNSTYKDYVYTENLDNGYIKRAIDKYNDYLEESEINIQNIGLITVKDLDNLTYNVTNQRLPLEDWTSNWTTGHHFDDSFNIVGSLKDYIPDKYSWIWSTTYWTRTAYQSGGGYPSFYFVDTWGDICNADFCFVDVGAGLRPIITISKSNILYKVTPITDENGTIEVVENALGNDIIQFKVLATKNYELESIIIRTDSGEEIMFTTGEIIKNNDGTYSIDKNKFTMPFENVTIEARFIDPLKNPKTGINNYVILVILILVISSLYVFLDATKKIN